VVKEVGGVGSHQSPGRSCIALALGLWGRGANLVVGQTW
jgi:hypothetical protein